MNTQVVVRTTTTRPTQPQGTISAEAKVLPHRLLIPLGHLHRPTLDGIEHLLSDNHLGNGLVQVVPEDSVALDGVDNEESGVL